MNRKIFAALTMASLLTANLQLIAADNSPATKPEAKAAAKSEVLIELEDLAARIRTKVDAGKKTEKDLAEELKQLDALLAKHSNETTDDVAEILLIKAMPLVGFCWAKTLISDVGFKAFGLICDDSPAEGLGQRLSLQLCVPDWTMR